MRQTFYVLTNPDFPNRFLTLTTKKKEASEYAEQFLYVQHLEHYKNWCFFQNLEITDESWSKYRSTISSEELEKYQILKLKFDRKGIATLLRMLYQCVPLGTSIDQAIEYQYILEKSNFYQSSEEEENEEQNMIS